MGKNKKQIINLTILIIAFFCCLFLLNACKNKSNEQDADENMRQNVESLSVFYDNNQIKNEESFSFEFGDMFKFEKFKIICNLKDQTSQELSNIERYININYEDFLGNITTNKEFDSQIIEPGIYDINIDFGEKFSFSVKINRQKISNLNLNFKYNSFSLGNLKSDNYEVTIEDRVLNKENYACLCLPVSQYKSLYGTDDKNQVLPQNLIYDGNEFLSLEVGKYFVAVLLKETKEYESCYSSVSEIEINPINSYLLDSPKSISYTFSTPTTYDPTLSNQTLLGLLNKDKEELSTHIKFNMKDDSVQYAWNARQYNLSGTWEFFDNETTENVVATNGRSVEPQNILSINEILSVQTNKYVFVKFIPTDTNYNPSELMLVYVEIYKGQILTPDNFYIAEENDLSGIDKLTYNGNNKILHYSFSYSNGDNYAINYFTENNQSGTLSGKLTLKMVSENYEFIISNQLEEKYYDNETNIGFKTTNINGILTIEWQLSPAEIETEIKDYTISNEQNILLEVSFNQTLYDTIENSCDFIVDNNAEILEKIYNEENMSVYLKIRIDQFIDNQKTFNLTVSPKNSHNKKIVLKSNTKLITVKKFVLTEKTIENLPDNSSINSLQNDDIFKELNKHYNITYKKINSYSEIIDENYNTSSILEHDDRILLELNSKNEFFALNLQSGKNFVLVFSYRTINLVIETTRIIATPSFEPYNITNTYEEQNNEIISGNIEINVSFDLQFEDAINNIFSIAIEGENAELIETTTNNNTFVLTIKISLPTNENFTSLDVLINTKPNYQEIYEVAQESENYVIERIDPENIEIYFSNQTTISNISQLIGLSQNYNVTFYLNDEIFNPSETIDQSLALTAVLTAKQNKFFYKEKTINVNFIKNN